MQDMNSMKSQSESLAKEYDRFETILHQNYSWHPIKYSACTYCIFSSKLFLIIKCTCTCRLMEEKDKLQRKVNIMGDDKKDD